MTEKKAGWKKVRTIAARALLIVLIAWVGLSALAALFYPRLLYHPMRDLVFGSPANFGAAYEELHLTAADGVTLNGWRIPADPATARGLAMLVFHGNAGNLSTMIPRLQLYHHLGVDIYSIDYHGFGRSGGEPSEKTLYLDADAVWRHVTQDRGVAPENIVVLGYSLGGGVASWLAQSNPGIRGLVLESTFTRLSDVGASLFPWLPCRVILGNAYNTWERLPGLSMPLLVVHGRGDALVPYRLGRQLYDCYPGEKTFLDIGDDHNLGFITAEKQYRQGLERFLDSLSSGTNEN